MFFCSPCFGLERRFVRSIVSIQDERTIRPRRLLRGFQVLHYIAVTFSDPPDDRGEYDEGDGKQWVPLRVSPSDYYGFVDSMELMPLSVIAGQSSPHVIPEHLSIHLYEKAMLHAQAFVTSPSREWDSGGRVSIYSCVKCFSPHSYCRSSV